MSFELDHFLPYRLSVTAGRISRGFARLYESEAGLSIAEWRVMAHLQHEGSVSVREIHARVDMDKSKVSRAASRLEEAGLVQKLVSETDRRLISLSLTEQGDALMQRLLKIATDYQAELVAELGELGPAFEAALTKLMTYGDQHHNDDDYSL